MFEKFCLSRRVRDAPPIKRADIRESLAGRQGEFTAAKQVNLPTLARMPYIPHDRS
jgi:hypothetical protein